MIKYSNLKARIIVSDFTLQTVAETIGIARTTLDKKLNGESDFTLGEMRAITNMLDLKPEERDSLFLL